ncbi:MAG: hypothetical protein OXT73_11535 [Bacteroidota bacterium]|nr:hypothetical protein [Bacteroidota bacterium]
MPTFVHYLPILTTVVAAAFTVVLHKRWRMKPTAYYLLWWMIGAAMYGVGTLTESITTVFGWNLITFKAWYISGALLGGAPLAQGTVYLLFQEKTAHRMSAALIAAVVIAAVCVAASPVSMILVEPHRLSGAVMEWDWVRLFSPFINIYAFIFLVGGAAWSAVRYARRAKTGATDPRRVWGNVWIAVGALLPGIGGSAARMGQVEVLYVTELVGLALIWLGYHVMTRSAARSIHASQRVVAKAS